MARVRGDDRAIIAKSSRTNPEVQPFTTKPDAPAPMPSFDSWIDLPQTKYLTTKVWLRHLHYTHNISGEPPPVAVKNKKKVVSIDESDKE